MKPLFELIQAWQDLAELYSSKQRGTDEYTFFDGKRHGLLKASRELQDRLEAWDMELRSAMLGNVSDKVFGVVHDAAHEWLSYARGGLGWCSCGKFGSESDTRPYAAWEEHAKMNSRGKARG